MSKFYFLSEKSKKIGVLEFFHDQEREGVKSYSEERPHLTKKD
jgi:hypothetical protein